MKEEDNGPLHVKHVADHVASSALSGSEGTDSLFSMLHPSHTLNKWHWSHFRMVAWPAHKLAVVVHLSLDLGSIDLLDV